MYLTPYSHYPQTTKVWGTEYELTNDNGLYCAKFLVLNQGFRCSLHCHHAKTETFFVLEGNVCLDIIYPDGLKTFVDLKTGENFEIPPYTYHRFWSSNNNAVMLEVSTPHSDKDVYRLEESGPIHG